MRRASFVVFVLSTAAICQQRSGSGPLTDQRVIELMQSGLRAEELNRLITAAPQVSFDLTPSAEDQMMKAGLSENTLKVMAEREQRLPTTGTSASIALPQRVKITVVETLTSEKNLALPIPGTPTRATTDCNSDYTHCSTTVTPGTDPKVLAMAISQAWVKAVLPNGKRVMLWCQAALRSCTPLQSGVYDAQVKGKTVWIDLVYPNGMIDKVKYKLRGEGWQ